MKNIESYTFSIQGPLSLDLTIYNIYNKNFIKKVIEVIEFVKYRIYISYKIIENNLIYNILSCQINIKILIT